MDQETTWFRYTTILYFLYLPVGVFLSLKALSLHLCPWENAIFLNLPFLHLCHCMLFVEQCSLTTGCDRSSFFPLLLFSYLSRLSMYLQSVAFLPRNQSTKGIRSSGMVRKWVVCTYPIRIQGRPHTHTYYILSAIACMYTPSRAIFLKRPWNCCLGNRHIVFQLSYSFSSAQVYTYGFLLVICVYATF